MFRLNATTHSDLRHPNGHRRYFRAFDPRFAVFAISTYTYAQSQKPYVPHGLPLAITQPWPDMPSIGGALCNDLANSLQRFFFLH